MWAFIIDSTWRQKSQKQPGGQWLWSSSFNLNLHRVQKILVDRQLRGTVAKHARRPPWRLQPPSASTHTYTQHKHTYTHVAFIQHLWHLSVTMIYLRKSVEQCHSATIVWIYRPHVWKHQVLAGNRWDHMATRVKRRSRTAHSVISTKIIQMDFLTESLERTRPLEKQGYWSRSRSPLVGAAFRPDLWPVNNEAVVSRAEIS